MSNDKYFHSLDAYFLESNIYDQLSPFALSRKRTARTIKRIIIRTLNKYKITNVLYSINRPYDAETDSLLTTLTFKLNEGTTNKNRKRYASHLKHPMTK